MNKMEVFVHVIDDDEACLKGISRFLRASGLSVKTFTSAANFMEQITIHTSGCILTDLDMPGMNGLELQSALSAQSHAMPIVFLTAKGDIATTVLAMREGAVDFLEKLAPKEKLLEAVKKALAKDEGQRAERTRLRELRERFNLLTQRELDVLLLVIRGQLNKQIGANLGICERTVKVHRKAITTKLKVPSVAEMTSMALDVGIFKSNVP